MRNCCHIRFERIGQAIQTTDQTNDGNLVKEIFPIASIEFVRCTDSREEKIISLALKGDVKRTYWYSCASEGETVYQLLVQALSGV